MRAGVETLRAARAGLRISVRLMITFVDAPWDRPVAERRTMKGTEEELRAMVAAYADAGVEELVIDANTHDLAKNHALVARVADALMTQVLVT